MIAKGVFYPDILIHNIKSLQPNHHRGDQYRLA